MASMLLFALTMVSIARADDNSEAPIAKVLSMIGDLESKLIKEGEGAQKVYEEFSDWCGDKSVDLGREIKQGKSEVAELKATIFEQSDEIEALTAKIEELVAKVSVDAKELKAATEVRAKENADFKEEEKELVETINMIDRAIEIIEKELAKSGGAAMLQMKTATNLAGVLSAMVHASVLNEADGNRLTALVQQQSAQESEDGDEDSASGAPAAAAYQGQSGQIVETLQGLLEKAETQLEAARTAETKSKNDYEMLKQSREDAMANANKEKKDAEKGMAKAGEIKSEAEGGLAVTEKDLKADIAALEQLHHDCMEKASNFEDEVNARDEELKALAQAKKIIKDATSLAQEKVASFLQVSRHRKIAKDARVVKFVKELGAKLKVAALSQLASRMQSALRFGNMAGEDPFAKVKGLINDMLVKLEKQAKEDATEKAYCDEEMKKSQEKKDGKDDAIEELTTLIEQKTAASDKLKEEVATLQAQLAKLAKSQQEMDTIRENEKKVYDETQPELEKGLKGIQLALKVLTEYYAGKDSGAGNGIMSMLEVCESDFSKNLADVEATEQAAVEEYEAETQENKVEKEAKTQDVKYKNMESTALDKAIAEASADRDQIQSELDAVMEYFAKIKDKCIAKPISYEEIQKRREAEINGLKEALTILESEAFVQIGSVRRTLRGIKPHSA